MRIKIKRREFEEPDTWQIPIENFAEALNNNWLKLWIKFDPQVLFQTSQFNTIRHFW